MLLAGRIIPKSIPSRRDRIAAIRADLRARLDAGEFGDQLYICALGHEWLLRAFVSTLLHMADAIASWPPKVRAVPHIRETASYVARELERVSETVGAPSSTP